MIPVTVLLTGQGAFDLASYKPLMPSVAFIGFHIMAVALAEAFDLALKVPGEGMTDDQRYAAVRLFLLCVLLLFGTLGVFAWNVARAGNADSALSPWAFGLNVGFILLCCGVVVFVRRSLEAYR